MGKNAIETYVHIVLIIFAAVIGTCFITVAMQHNIAQRVHADIIKDIEAGDFSEVVIEEILYSVNNENGDIQKAFPGCKVEINPVQDAGSTATPNSVIDKVAEVKLTYYYDAFIFIHPIEYELVGYAR